LDDFHALASHVAHRIGRVDVIDNPREAIVLMELGMDFQQHLHTSMNPLSRYPLKLGFQEHPSVAPTGGMRLGYRRIGVFIFLYQLHIAVPSVAFTSLGEFRFHPITIGQRHRNDIAHQRVEFV